MFTRSSAHIFRHFETTDAIEAILEILRKSGLRKATRGVCIETHVTFNNKYR